MSKDKNTTKTEHKESKMDSKIRAAQELVKSLNEKFGKGAVFVGNDSIGPIDVVSTGSLQLNACIGVGGYPRGRIVEVYGHESTGKTTLTLHAIAEAQRAGLSCAFIDAEHALDLGYARKLGVNTDTLIITQPDNGEQALEIYLAMAGSKAVDVVVVDSVAALVPKAELEGEMGDAHVGRQARLLSQFCRKAAPVTAENNVLCFMINQIRMKIGVMYGNPETTTGGNALKFYSSVRLNVRKGEKIKQGENIIGHFMRVKVEKNKVAPPFRECEIPVIFGRGIDRVNEVYAIAVSLGVIQVSGGSHTYNGEKIARSKDDAKSQLATNQKLFEGLEKAAIEALTANSILDIAPHKAAEVEVAPAEVEGEK